MKKEQENSFLEKIICILILAIIVGIFLINFKNDSTSKIPEEPVKDSTIESELERILKKSSYFKDSQYEFDKKNNTLKIDDKYIVSIKNGSYLMDIRDSKIEEAYCQIVDAIETHLGNGEGKSIETCKKTLEGSIALGGISAEIYDSYKVLTVNSGTPATLYDTDRTRTENELISEDEINYNVTIDNYLFTSMSTSYNESEKDLAICGHVYNEKNKENNFKIKIYDENKKQIDEKTFTYTNDKKKYLPFCVNYKLATDTVAYFSIEAQK